MKRKLTTIFYADAVRFGARMESDEAGALASLREARTMMRDLFAAHDGREVNTWGDAVIAEFPSVVEAVRCAVAVQEAMGSEHAAGAPEGRLIFRIGVNLGDVMIDGDDIYGDGVNVAERLQSLAEPGGVMVSGTVRDLAHKQLALAFDFVGDQEVKSKSEPVPSWSVRMSRANAQADAPARPPLPAWAGEHGLQRWIAWFQAQPKTVRRAAAMIILFFALNLFFTGLARPWFIFPSLPFVLIIWRRRDPRIFPWQDPAQPRG